MRLGPCPVANRASLEHITVSSLAFISASAALFGLYFELLSTCMGLSPWPLHNTWRPEDARGVPCRVLN